jgi:hypothetical protein
MMMLRRFAIAAVLGLVWLVPAAQANPAEGRLTNDNRGTGYVSDYTPVTEQPYIDPVLSACSQTRGRQRAGCRGRPALHLHRCADGTAAAAGRDATPHRDRAAPLAATRREYPEEVRLRALELVDAGA